MSQLNFFLSLFFTKIHVAEGRFLVSYLTPDSDLDLAPDPDQFAALPPIRYINL